MPGAPGSVAWAWAWAGEGLSSGPGSALTGQATLAKWLSLFELRLLPLQNGDSEAVIYLIGSLWGAMPLGTVRAQSRLVIIISLVLSTLS